MKTKPIADFQARSQTVRKESTLLKMTLAPLALVAAALFIAPAVPVAAQSTDTVLTPRTFINVARDVLPAVVSIHVDIPPSQELLDQNGSTSREEFLRRFMLDPDEDIMRRFDAEDFGYTGAGSGVIVDKRDGWAYVVTNNHVLESSERVRYTITLDSSYNERARVEVQGDDVEIVGTDPLTDLAVLRFREPAGLDLKTSAFADSNTIEIGEWVLALGNPLELNNSVSQGIVSGKNRVINKTAIENLIQTTAVINPGNSGGPLVNLDGKIIGINNAIATTTGRWAGVGFAIPGNEAARISQMLIDNGRVTRGYLGITMQDLSSSLADAMGLDQNEGVLIAQIQPGSPAEKSGFEIGDIVTHVEDQPVSDMKGLLRAIGGKNANETVNIQIKRFADNSDLEKKSYAVTLMERPSEEELRKFQNEVEQEQMKAFGEKLREQLGMIQDGESPQSGETSLLLVENDPIELLGLDVTPTDSGGVKGMRVEGVERESKAWQAGLRPGAIILRVNGERATSRKAMEDALGKIEEGKKHVVLFRFANRNTFITMDQAEDDE
ncbi:MAG: trypsin-like peptidase domain-containing protein [Sumerlaeia bacterium]